MFSAVLISCSADRSHVLKTAALETGGLLLLRILERYPVQHQLATVLNTTNPDIILLDLFDADLALASAIHVASHGSTAAIIGLLEPGREVRPELETAVPVRIPFPPEPFQIIGAVDEAIHRLRCPVEPNLLAFLPAKAGSGASTIALNTATALAARRRKVLLIEADLRSGILSGMLRTEPQHSIHELLRGADELDKFRVANAIHRAHGVDFLLSRGSFTGPLPSWKDYFHLLEVVRQKYDHIVVDLPELINPATREIVQRSQYVFNVSTPEMLALQLAERRCRELTAWKVPDHCVRIILNRWKLPSAQTADIQNQLERAVARTFPNDYGAVQRALELGRPMSWDTALGRCFVEFAAELCGAAPVQPRLAKNDHALHELLRRLWKTA